MNIRPCLIAGLMGVCLGTPLSAGNVGERSLKDRLTEPELRERLDRLEESLALARTEADYFHQQWTEMRLRAEALGVEALTGNEKALEERIVQLIGELYRSEKRNVELEKAVDELVAAGRRLQQAGTLERAQRRAEYEVAVRAAQRLRDPSEGSGIRVAPDLNSGFVTVFDPDMGVAIINFGRAQEAREGMPFRILRGDRPIGRCRLIEVREYLSAALVEGVIPNETVQAGDRLLLETTR